jgi:DNA-binding transcriptional ArsR family regulator
MLDKQIQELTPNISSAAHLMEMLSNPVRLRILCQLLTEEKSVLVLADLVGLSQPAMSHHLKKLRIAELVDTRREAQTIYYSLKGDEVLTIMTVLHKLYCQHETPRELKSAMQ